MVWFGWREREEKKKASLRDFSFCLRSLALSLPLGRFYRVSTGATEGPWPRRAFLSSGGRKLTQSPDQYSRRRKNGHRQQYPVIYEERTCWSSIKEQIKWKTNCTKRYEHKLNTGPLPRHTRDSHWSIQLKYSMERQDKSMQCFMRSKSSLWLYCPIDSGFSLINAWV